MHFVDVINKTQIIAVTWELCLFWMIACAIDSNDWAISCHLNRRQIHMNVCLFYYAIKLQINVPLSNQYQLHVTIANVLGSEKYSVLWTAVSCKIFKGLTQQTAETFISSVQTVKNKHTPQHSCCTVYWMNLNHTIVQLDCINIMLEDYQK